MYINSILRTKGTHVYSVGPDAPMHEIVTTLNAHKIGAVVVCGPDSSVLGIISERDIVGALAEHGADALNKPARDLMTAEVITCSPRDTAETLMGWMTSHRIRHLPVIEDGKLSGMVSIGDVVKHRLEEVESEASQLRSFITS